MNEMESQALRTIPSVDLQAQYAAYREEIDVAISGVLESARFIGGP